MLTKTNAPDCAKCGCNGTRLVGAGTCAGRPWARYECDFCGKIFTVGTSPLEAGVVNGVVYQTTKCKCPKCDAKNPKVRSTQGRIRYHKCENCGQGFKSVEEKTS